MKTSSFWLLGAIVLGLLVLTACPKPQKPLLYQQDGNYIVDDNYIYKKTATMDAKDLDALVALDIQYDTITKGTAILRYIVNARRIRQLNQLNELTRIERLSRIVDFNHIIKGCFEKQQIDWTMYGDLKARIDGIINKYNPAMVDGNVAIQKDQIATEVVKLQEQDVQSFLDMSVIGQEEADICGDYMGVLRYSRILHSITKVTPDKAKFAKLDKVLAQYQ